MYSSKLAVVLVGLCVSGGVFAAGDAVHMSSYPSMSQVKKMKQNGVTQLILGSRFVSGAVATRLGYPSASHVKNLNEFQEADIRVATYTTGFPSIAVSKRLTKLQNHVTLKLRIENCLSSSNEANKIVRIGRDAKVVTECHTDRSAEKARKIGDAIEKKNSKITVTVLRVKD